MYHNGRQERMQRPATFSFSSNDTSDGFEASTQPRELSGGLKEPCAIFVSYEKRYLTEPVLEQRYRVLIDGLYAGETDIDCQIAVTYQDGRQGVLRAKVVGTDVNSASSP